MADCQRWISSAEFSEWIAYNSLEPFGEDIANWRAAMIARTMAEIHRNRESRHEPFKIDEFMPVSNPVEVTAQPWQVLLEKVRIANAAFGGEDFTDVG